MNIFKVMHALEKEGLHYRVDAFQADALTLTVSVPGQLWEVQFFEQDEPNIQYFKSDGQLDDVDEDYLSKLIADWAD